MNNARIYVAVSCHNRRQVAELCLPTLTESVSFMDKLVLHNDGSSEYDAAWLRQFTVPAMNHHVIDHPKLLGIQAQRRLHLADFLAGKEFFTHLYLTDHDCLHDPSWAPNALTLQEKYDAPLCLYDTQAHRRLVGNTIEDNPASEVIWRRVAPGVSYLLTRAHVEKLAPHISKIEHFDWEIPALLGGRFAVSRVGYIDHIGWGGQRHPPEEGLDGGDRVVAPTPWLVAKRAEVVGRLGAK